MLKHPYPTSVTAVDPCVLDKEHFQGSFPQEDTIRRTLSKVSPPGCELRNPWELIVGFSPGAIPTHKLYDMIFIDGDNSYQGVWSDYNATFKLLRPGGFLVFDDYLDYKDSPEVRVAVDEIARATDLVVVGLLENIHQISGHSDQVGEYIFQKLEPFSPRTDKENLSSRLLPTLCIVVATHERLDGSSPRNLERLWKMLSEQSYDNWKLYLTGDAYANSTEFNSLSFAGESKANVVNRAEPGERGLMNEEMIWMNGGVAAVNDSIERALSDGFEWVVHLDDDDIWDADHLGNILAGIQTGATFVMTGAQHIQGYLPHERAIKQIKIRHDVLPAPCAVIHSATAFNSKEITSRYAVSLMPADASLWSRIIFDEKFSMAYVPVDSVHHVAEKGMNGNAYVGRLCTLIGIDIPHGWTFTEYKTLSDQEYVSLATDQFPEHVSHHCKHIIGPFSATSGFRRLDDADVPYYIRVSKAFENLPVWEALT